MFCCLKMTDAYFIIIISRLFHLAVGQPFLCCHVLWRCLYAHLLDGCVFLLISSMCCENRKLCGQNKPVEPLRRQYLKLECILA